MTTIVRSHVASASQTWCVCFEKGKLRQRAHGVRVFGLIYVGGSKRRQSCTGRAIWIIVHETLCSQRGCLYGNNGANQHCSVRKRGSTRVVSVFTCLFTSKPSSSRQSGQRVSGSNDPASCNIEYSKRRTERSATFEQGFSIPGTVSSEFGKKELHSWRSGFYTRLLAHAERAAATVAAASPAAAAVEAATTEGTDNGTPEEDREAAREAAAIKTETDDGYPKIVAFAGKRQVFLLLEAAVAATQSNYCGYHRQLWHARFGAHATTTNFCTLRT